MYKCHIVAPRMCTCTVGSKHRKAYSRVWPVIGPEIAVDGPLTRAVESNLGNFRRITESPELSPGHGTVTGRAKFSVVDKRRERKPDIREHD